MNREGPKENDDYKWRKSFEVKRIGTENRLMRKRSTSQRSFKFFAAFEEVYQAVKEAHAAVGHGSEKKSFAETKKKWSNITQECCKAYISFCIDCQEKKLRSVPIGLVIKPARSDDIFSIFF